MVSLPQRSVLPFQVPIALASAANAPSISNALVNPILSLAAPVAVASRGRVAVPPSLRAAEKIREAETVVTDLSKSEQTKAIGHDEVYKLTMKGFADASKAANVVRAERVRQAKNTFNAALALVVIGVLVIFTGVGLVLYREGLGQGLLRHPSAP